MPLEVELSCVVSGSFSKFKPEVDLAIIEFVDLGVDVLAPDTGWLYVDPFSSEAEEYQDFRPLPSEVGQSGNEVKYGFLETMRNADFQYVVNPEFFIGSMVTGEIGFAYAQRIPTYALRNVATYGFEMYRWLLEDIRALPPAEVVKEMEAKKLAEIQKAEAATSQIIYTRRRV